MKLAKNLTMALSVLTAAYGANALANVQVNPSVGMNWATAENNETSTAVVGKVEALQPLGESKFSVGLGLSAANHLTGDDLNKVHATQSDAKGYDLNTTAKVQYDLGSAGPVKANFGAERTLWGQRNMEFKDAKMEGSLDSTLISLGARVDLASNVAMTASYAVGNTDIISTTTPTI